MATSGNERKGRGPQFQPRRGGQPDARRFKDNRPARMRILLQITGLSREECARLTGVSLRTLYRYLSDRTKAEQRAPYPFQFLLECMAAKVGKRRFLSDPSCHCVTESICPMGQPSTDILTLPAENVAEGSDTSNVGRR